MDEERSTLRMLRRRYCRCNLLLLLAVCGAVVVVLYYYGLPDGREGGDNMEDNTNLSVEGSDDREEEQEEENAKQMQNQNQEPIKPPPKSEENKPKAKERPIETKQKEDVKEADKKTEAEPHKEAVPKSAEKVVPKTPKEETPKAPEKPVPKKVEDKKPETAEKKSENQRPQDEKSQQIPPKKSESSSEAEKSEKSVERNDNVDKDAKSSKSATENKPQEKKEEKNLPGLKVQIQNPPPTIPPPTPPPVVKITKAPVVYEQKRQLPKVILIGAVSCPVDVVVSFLHLHPDIVLGGDVINFFNDDDKYKRGVSWYASQMPLSYPDQVTIDVNPTYYLSSRAPERIHTMNPNTKLIFVVCDPIMRALAHHVKTSEDEDFDEVAFNDNKNGGVNAGSEAIQYSLYFYHLQRWLKIFPKNQLLVIDVGTLRKNFQVEMTNIENFLGVRPNVLQVPAGVNPASKKKLQKFFQNHNEDFFKAIGRRFDWQ